MLNRISLFNSSTPYIDITFVSVMRGERMMKIELESTIYLDDRGAAILRGDIDKIALTAQVVLLLARNHLLRQPVNDLQQTNLILSVFREVEQPVGPQPKFRMTQMQDVTHSVKGDETLTVLR